MQKIEITTTDNSKSEIIIERGLSKKIEEFFENKKYFLITNTTLKKLCSDFIKKFPSNRVIVVPDGEKYKNYKTFNFIIESLLKEKIERKDCIIALGGGVIGDLAGYAASSVLRGVELFQVPTTLLAMCDSSIGGKTGYNTKYGKNLVGSFYLASRVLIDSLFIETLSDYEFKCGLGEVLKYAFIEKSCKCNTSYNLFELLLDTKDIYQSIDHIIQASADLKACVVNFDKLEGGLRKILNFGHTYAHAIETLSNYKNISHGEAVAIGMKYASKLAFDLGKIDEQYYSKINFLIDKFKLQSHSAKFKKEKIVNLMKQDKKVIDNKINLLLPTATAKVELFDNIDLPLIEASLP